MVTTTVVDHSHACDRPLQLDSIPTVDLRLLSQSEIYSLSLCSDSAFDLRRCDDVVIPKIDRSVFNESAGSRKQTYSRLRLAPASSSSPSSIHRRTPHLRSHLPPSTSRNDPEQPQNSMIINLLKELFKSDPNCIDMIPIEVEDTKPKPYLYPNSNPVQDVSNPVMENEIVGKRKRGRPRKGEKVIKPAKVKPSNHNVVKQIAVFENVEDRDREIVNRKGVVLDVVVLAALEDPYGPEIRRRTVGMSTEDQLLGFLKGLNGQWGSRRKKKRVVDASDFGDALPKGWRLSLSIKKKVGRVWLFCRRYISPSGRQFASCSEVSSYLLSIREPQNVNNSQKNNDNQHGPIVASGKAADLVLQEAKNNIDTAVFYSSSSLSTNHEKPLMSKIGDPVEIQLGEELQVNSNENSLAEESSDDPVRNCTTSNDKLYGMDEGPDVVAAKSDVGMVCAAALCNNENNINSEPAGETHAIHTVDSETNKCFPEDETSRNCRLSPFPNEPVSGVAVCNVVEVSADAEMKNEELVSETGFLPSSTSGKIDCTESLSDMQFASTADELTVDTDKVANGESLYGFCNTPSGLDKDDVAEVKQLSSFERSEESAEKANVLIPSLKAESEMKSCVVSSIYIPSGDEETPSVDSNLNGVSLSSLSPKLDENNTIWRNEFRSYAGSDAEVLTSLEKEKNFKNCSAVSSWREQVCASENSGNVISTCMVEEPRKQASWECSLLHTDCDQTCRVENHVDKVYTIELEEVKLKEFQKLRDSEPSIPAKNSLSQLNLSAMTITKERDLEFCSLVSSGNEHTFDLQDDVTGLYNSAMEDCREENSERGLLNQFCITESSDDVFVNKLYTSPLDELKFDEERDIANHELSLAFGNPHSGLYADPSSVEQKRDIVNRSFTPSEIEQSFGVQTNLSMVNSSLVHDLKEGRGLNSSLVHDLKEGRGSMSDLFSLSCNSGTSGFGNHFNTRCAGREWEDRKSDDVGNSVNKKYMLGFGSSPYQPVEDVVPSALWKAGEGHALQNGLADPSPPLVQSPNCFRSFDILSDKAEDELFRVGEKYNNGPSVGGFGAVRSEPIEFSFLTTHNSNSLQGNPKVFSYGPEMGQEFNPSFWLGKDAPVPNIAVNQVTAVCVWCRNEFHHEPGHSGIQSGYGSMCPTCSARISHQVNIL